MRKSGTEGDKKEKALLELFELWYMEFVENKSISGRLELIPEFKNFFKEVRK